MAAPITAREINEEHSTNRGRVPVETLGQSQTVPDVSAPQRATVELVKRIRKLRWIGLRDEADRLKIALSGRRYAIVDPQQSN